MLEAVFWDVQHGSAAYFKTPNNTHIVQDLGTGSLANGDSSFSPLQHLKSHYGVAQLDFVIITHPHRDHLDDIFSFDDLSPRVLLRPKHLTEQEIRDANHDDGGILDTYFEINNRYNSSVADEDNPRLSQNNGGVTIQTFIPKNCGRSNLNNHSVVTVMEYATSKILIPGDNEPPSWKELLEDAAFCDAIGGVDIFVAPHHGRESAYHAELFRYFKPKLTIISDGPSDTSAVSAYSQASSGWKVHFRDGGAEERYCLTTRKDGVIVVKFGYNSSEKPFIAVTAG